MTSINTMIRRYLPKGWRVYYARQGRYHATAIWPDKMIVVEPIASVETLLYFLHECAHVKLGHFSDFYIENTEEYAAERWAIDTLRKNGFVVPRDVVGRARGRVLTQIEADEKRGDPIDATIRRWAERK